MKAMIEFGDVFCSPLLWNQLIATKWFSTPNNKLRSIKPSTRPFPSSRCSNRQWEVALCRLRIGHTHLTHSYFMDHHRLPYCLDPSPLNTSSVNVLPTWWNASAFSMAFLSQISLMSLMLPIMALSFVLYSLLTSSLNFNILSVLLTPFSAL